MGIETKQKRFMMKKPPTNLSKEQLSCTIMFGNKFSFPEVCARMSREIVGDYGIDYKQYDKEYFMANMESIRLRSGSWNKLYADTSVPESDGDFAARLAKFADQIA